MNRDTSKLNLTSDPSVESIDEEIADLVKDVKTPKAHDSRADRGSHAARQSRPAPSTPMIATVSALLCLAMTMFNLGFFSANKRPPVLSAADARADLDASLEVDVALLQGHREFHGAYPSDPEDAGLDPEGTFYQRISPQEFTLTLEESGYAVSVDSRDIPKENQSDEAEDFR